jgi:hypothetical protein
MSIKRLNGDERATYFLGLAVRWQMEEAGHNFDATGKTDPESDKSQRVFNGIFRWTERWLPPDEIDNISASTGYFIREEFQREMLGEVFPRCPVRRRKLDKPDDIPF